EKTTPDVPERFPGLLPLMEQVYDNIIRGKKDRELLNQFRAEVVCRDCGGSRLRPEARAVTIGKRRIFEICSYTIAESLEFFNKLEFSQTQQQIATPIIEQIAKRLDFMSRIGLDYLTLDRPAKTLSGGELQRVRLATGLGSGLVGVCYILDEPSVGLHPRDNQRLINAMRDLQKQGNSVLVVEHDETIMREADWIIDMGVGAGRLGGRVIAEGTQSDIRNNAESITGHFLSGRETIPLPAQRRKAVKSRSITLEGVTTNNLRNVSVQFPLGTFICVTGVSGSGKSSLLNETLVPAVIRRLTGAGTPPGPHKSLRGTTKIDKLIQIDQSPIGRSPRSNPATYSSVFDEIRKVFASTKDAKRFGFKSGRFSFNIPGGRCEECQGQGMQKIEMHFLPDLYAECPQCNGKRFNRQTLGIHYKGKSIADVLDMEIDEAAVFFENYPAIVRQLESMQRVGLGYLTLGQSATTLSGGEAQRIKLATELARVETGNTLYVLDEPTSGLHAHDIKQLLGVLSQLVDNGNTVIVIEHNLDVIKTADWIIDLGPDGGENGGHVTATGTPEDIAKLEDNYTGQFLKKVLSRE
ncbi:MAG: excinuclease ABC subunit UvrA, partial [Thermoguttaceae bacterium]